MGVQDKYMVRAQEYFIKNFEERINESIKSWEEARAFEKEQNEKREKLSAERKAEREKNKAEREKESADRKKKEAEDLERIKKRNAESKAKRKAIMDKIAARK